MRNTILHRGNKDHPRVCGKNELLESLRNESVGSPPRVREKQGWYKCQPKSFRITPACAGKTCLVSLRCLCSWDHPRVCGKNLYTLAYKACSSGSPPRVREKLSGEAWCGASGGITPACAGKTLKNPCSKLL